MKEKLTIKFSYLVIREIEIDINEISNHPNNREDQEEYKNVIELIEDHLIHPDYITNNDLSEFSGMINIKHISANNETIEDLEELNKKIINNYLKKQRKNKLEEINKNLEL